MHPALQASLENFKRSQASVQALNVADAVAKKSDAKRGRSGGSGSDSAAGRTAATARAAQAGARLTIKTKAAAASNAAGAGYDPSSAPIYKQLKDVIDCLKQEGRPLAADEILDKTRIDIEANAELLNAVRNNEKVRHNSMRPICLVFVLQDASNCNISATHCGLCLYTIAVVTSVAVHLNDGCTSTWHCCCLLLQRGPL